MPVPDGHGVGMTIGPAFRFALLLAAIPSLSGCLAKTMVNIATAPVRMVDKTVDLATTSQSESDEKRGRELRRRNERLAQLESAYHRHSVQCDAGDDDACDKREAEAAEMARLRPGYDPD